MLHNIFRTKIYGFLLFLTLGALTSALNVFAEPTVLPWQPIGWGGGGWVDVVKIDPDNPDVMYAAIDMGGFYQSLDAGEHWQMINDPQKSGRATTDLLISRHSQTIYAASNIGFLRARQVNGGFQWDLLSSEIRNHYGVRGYPMPEADLSNFVRSIAEHPTDPDILYVISATGGVYKTTNAGETFIQVNQGVLAQGFDSYVRSIAINPYNPNVLLVGTNNAGLYRTDNAGSSWRREGQGSISDLKIADVIFSEDLPNTAYCLGRYGGFYKSTDGGMTWLASNQGINLPVNAGGGFINIALDPSNPSNIYIGAKSKNGRPFPIYRSTDGGLNWLPLAWWPIINPPNSPYQSWNAFGEATNIAIHPTNSDILYASYGQAILKSENATALPGNDYVLVGPWYPKYDGLGVATSWQNGVHPLSNGKLLVVGGDDTFELTINEGLTWTQIRTANMVHGQSLGAVTYPQEPNHIYAVLGIPHTPSVDKPSVYRTTDGGLTWPSIAPTNIQLGDIIRSIAGHPSDVNTLYIGVVGSLASRGVYKTTNAAALLPSSVIWEKKLDGDIFEVAVDPANPDHILAAAYNGEDIQTTNLYRSTDGAQSWEQVLVNAFGNEPAAIVFSQTDSNVVFLVTAWCLYRSSNNGQTWTDIRYPAPIYDRLFTDLVSHPTVEGLVFLGGQAGPAVLQSTGVWMSLNNGDTWMPAADGLLFPAIVSLAISPDGNSLYGMASGASLWKATLQIQAAVNQPPSVNILTPREGEIVSGIIHFAADANDPDGSIQRVEFYVDNVLKYTATTRYYLSGVYSRWVDTNGYVNGRHTLKVIAYDNEDAQANHEIAVTINNPLPNQAPTVNILTPAMGEEIAGIGTHFAANASDDNRVARVEFYVDGILKHTAYERFYLSGVYSSWINTLTYPNGKHRLKAKALDEQGLEASHEIVVIINNPQPSSPTKPSLNNSDNIPLPSLPTKPSLDAGNIPAPSSPTKPVESPAILTPLPQGPIKSIPGTAPVLSQSPLKSKPGLSVTAGKAASVYAAGKTKSRKSKTSSRRSVRVTSFDTSLGN